MEIKLLDGDIVLKQEVLNEIEDKIKYEVEWYYEQTGEIADSQDVFEKVTKDMENEGWLLDACDMFFEESETYFDDIVKGIEEGFKDMNVIDPNAGQNFYDRHL
jgi:hypothetical protein